MVSSYSLNWFDNTVFRIYGIISLYVQSLIIIVHFVLRFCEALLGLLNPIDKNFDVWIYTFHLEASEFMIILCSCEQQSSILLYVTDHASFFKKTNKKTNRNKSQKRFLNENKHM